jgi:hypothetical protein
MPAIMPAKTTALAKLNILVTPGDAGAKATRLRLPSVVDNELQRLKAV